MNRLHRGFRHVLQTSIVLAICVLLAAPAFAQQATGRIVGTITDPQGAVLPGVTVTAINVATDVKSHTVTNKDGYYQVLNLPVGNYRITAERDNFRKLLTEAQKLEINQALRMDLKMELGARTETVTVEANAVMVDTVNATLGQTVTERVVQDMPLNGRNVLDLALLQPGVTEVNPGATDNAQQGTYGIAGGKSDSVTFLLDGGVNNGILGNEVIFNPSPDTVQEFKILTSNYSAEYGRNAGGIISVVTKSGTNTLHGSAYDFLRNDALDANKYFNNQQGIPRDVLKRNQFGATLGGPIYIPGVVNGKDKYFWFLSYSGQRQTQGITGQAVPVFTPAELGGDFSHAVNNGPDPNVAAFLLANPYYQANVANAANAIIDPAKIDPVAAAYITANLISSDPSGSRLPRGTSTDNSDQITTKLDAQFNPNNKLSATLGWGRNPLLNPFSYTFGSTPSDALGFGSTSDNHRWFANIAWNHTFSASLLNEARFTAQRITHFQAIPASANGVPASQLPTPAQLGIAVTPDQVTGPTRLFFDNGLDVGFSPQGPTTETDNTFTWADTLSWVKGKHTMKFGFLFSPYQDNTNYDFYVDGEFDFISLCGSPPVPCYSGNSFADFLLGLPNIYFQSSHAPSNIRSKAYAAFAQDEWHVRKNLVITYGLRYEYNSPKRDTQGRTFSIVPGAPQSTRFVNAPSGLVFPGDAGAPDGSNFPDRNNFAPRIGFAWDPFGNGRTSVRGGFGMFYDFLKGEDNLQFNGQPPFFGYSFFGFPAAPILAAPNDMSTPYAASGNTNPFPSTPPASNVDFSPFLPYGIGLYFVDPHLKTPYTYQYNLSIQHELATGLVLEVSYVGNSTHGQTALADANPMVPGTTDRVLNLLPGNSTCVFNTYACTFGALPEFQNVVRANYNSLEASLTKRITGGHWYSSSYFTFAYTWGKSIDNASGFRNVNSQVPAYNHELFRAVSDYDVTNRIVFSGGWDLPFDRAWSSGPKRLVKGWSIYPIVTWRSGFPMDLNGQLSDSDPADPGTSGFGDPLLTRVNVNTNNVPIFNPHQIQTLGGNTGSFYFDPTVFDNTIYAPGSYGTYPRNYLRGPSRSNFDFAISKKTPLSGERLVVDFRAEFFNILNSTQFQMPDLNIFSSTFGQVTSTYPPRIIQFGLRFSF